MPSPEAALCSCSITSTPSIPAALAIASYSGCIIEISNMGGTDVSSIIQGMQTCGDALIQRENANQATAKPRL